MHKKLIIDTFEKVKENEITRGIKRPSNDHISKTLSDFIHDEMNFDFGKRSLKNYYNHALKIEDVDEDINILQLNVILGLCKYLGFGNYEDYVRSININNEGVVYDLYSDNGKSNIKIKQKNKKLFVWFSNASAYNKILLIGIVVVIITTFYFYENQPRWMVWDQDHYVEVKFDSDKYNIGQLKLYNEDRINDLKKIKANCETEFFDSNGGVKIWYGKNINKELEYFTALGLHPETGKTLDPITVYMIRKHICKEY